MLQWYASDGTTPIGGLNFGKVGPGESYHDKHSEYLEVVLKNAGAETIEDVVVDVTQMLGFPAYEYVRFAEGETEPGSEAFIEPHEGPLAIGNLTPAATARLWFDLVVPAYAPRAEMQRVRLVAYGYEGEGEGE